LAAVVVMKAKGRKGNLPFQVVVKKKHAGENNIEGGRSNGETLFLTKTNRIF